MLLAYLVPAMGSLTSLNLGENQLCGLDKYEDGTYSAEGITAIADALRVNGSLTSIDLSRNQLCGLNWDGKGNYTTVGITAIADALRANGSLTKMWYVSPRTNLSEFGPSFLHPCVSDGDCQCTTLLCEAAHCRCRSCVMQPSAPPLCASALRSCTLHVLQRRAPPLHILPLTLPTALCNLTTNSLCLFAALRTTTSMSKPSKLSKTYGGATPST